MGWLWAIASAATWEVDASTTAAAVGRWSVREAIVCEGEAELASLRGEPLSTRGVAVVVYSRKQGTMLWGHASLRAVGCWAGQPFDWEYEVYRFGPGNWGEISRVLAGDEVLDDAEYLRAQRGALFRFRNDDPVDGGFFAASHARNREIYELWLDLAAPERDHIVSTLEAGLDEQARRLRAREPLEGRYGALSTNCTLPIQELLNQRWHLPYRWMRELQDDALRRVVHPSHHLLGAWDSLPTTSERPRVIFRRPSDPEDWPVSVGEQRPILPWTPQSPQP